MKRISQVLLKIVVLSFVFATSPLSLHSKKTTIKLKAPKEKVTTFKKNHRKTAKDKEEFTEIAKKLTFTGYDKKAGASTETFFINNGSDKTIKSIELEITYLGSGGKQLHKREVEIEEEIPAGETRKIDIQSWDKQKHFHYVKSDAGKNGSAPYTVRFKIKSILTD